VDDVGAGQHLTYSNQLGELAIAEPRALFDEHAPRPWHDTAKAQQADFQKRRNKHRARDRRMRESLVLLRAHAHPASATTPDGILARTGTPACRAYFKCSGARSMLEEIRGDGPPASTECRRRARRRS